MKVLTICQPFASLIVGGRGVYVGELKRIENRTRPVRYRGPLLIHAGKSEEWLWRADELDSRPKELHFGRIVGKAELVDCVGLEELALLLRIPYEELDPKDRRWAEFGRLAWCLRNRHASGPYLWILANVRRFLSPVPFRGRQGLFEVPHGERIVKRPSVPPTFGCVDEGAATCRVCGCTDRHGCDCGGEGCYWVEPDLCSACAADLRRAAP